MASPKPLSGIQSRLPVELSTFVGRRDELASIKRLLGAGRLVSLIGPGGVGKTRLALRTARDVARNFEDGVFFVALSEIRDPTVITQSVVGALGLQDRSVAWSVPMLTEHLAAKRLLLVFDNCEHLLDAAAVLAGTLLRNCPDLRIIATSRQALGVAGEIVESVPPLALPDFDEGSTTEALRSDGVALFVERATSSDPGFTVNDMTIGRVLELCRRLDGVALALELAAVRLNALGLDALVEGLRDRLDLLGSGDRSTEPRQRTLDATIDWSYQLLTEPERILWTRLSVFAGGFELDAAQEVCSDESLEAGAIGGLLAALVEKSLVKAGEHGGRERYRVLEILRQFARERLREAGAERAFRARHAAWIAGIATRTAADDRGLAELLARLRVERTNLWTALDFCLDDEAELSRGIGICRDLYNFWLAEGHFSQVVGMLAAFLDRAPAADRPRAEVLWVSALIYTTMADAAEGRRLSREALAIGRSIGAADIVASALLGEASALWVEGRWDEAIAAAQEVACFSRVMALHHQELTALNILALTQRFSGDIPAAIETGRQALVVSDGLGEVWLRGYALHFLAAALFRGGRTEEAERLAREALEIRRDLGHMHGLGSLAELLANVEVTRGHEERAVILFGGADAIWQSISWRHTDSNQQEHDRVRAELQARLGSAKYERAYATGLSMTVTEVIGVALGDPLPTRPPSVRRTRSSASVLSPRELEIAQLMADGVSNAQAAAQLFIGERTVETHVTNIFNKLGVDSRVHVARWVAAQEAAPES